MNFSVEQHIQDLITVMYACDDVRRSCRSIVSLKAARDPRLCCNCAHVFDQSELESFNDKHFSDQLMSTNNDDEADGERLDRTENTQEQIREDIGEDYLTLQNSWKLYPTASGNPICPVCQADAGWANVPWLSTHVEEMEAGVLKLHDCNFLHGLQQQNTDGDGQRMQRQLSTNSQQKVTLRRKQTIEQTVSITTNSPPVKPKRVLSGRDDGGENTAATLAANRRSLKNLIKHQEEVDTVPAKLPTPTKKSYSITSGIVTSFIWMLTGLLIYGVAMFCTLALSFNFD